MFRSIRTVIADYYFGNLCKTRRFVTLLGLELLSATFIFCVLVTLVLYITGRTSSDKSSSLKPHVSGNLLHDWWFGIQLNPQFIGIDLKWDIIAERLGFMLGWWLLHNKVELTVPAVVANFFVFLIGYMVFRGANKQKHIFKKSPKTPIWGKPPVVVGGKLLASGYWGIARHCNYLGDLMLALSFCLPCGISSPVPYFYPIYLLILLIWRERRDEERCAEKYKEIWAEYLRLVPYRILPYVY
ncbi:hypothetical protein F2Q69_00015474 [Brassica cretica]|uniref:Delta(14)-sterol reductase n=1 Tax=Brassica cretica TaxID=69181 RepID=A0A8S9QXK1_BRACR|nr:hypothetical protein F2Q69_00015474 [Brassica cretica]